MWKINQYFEFSASVIYFENFRKNSKENADAGVTFLRKRLQNSCFFLDFNPHMNEIFLQCYCMKWVPGDTQKKTVK